MSIHDFTALYDHYPEVTEAMPREFTSHRFILELARRHQTEYVEALHAYRNTLWKGVPAPFMMVHSQLALQLESMPHLVRKVSPVVPSTDIFGTRNTAALWQKTRAG